MKQACTQCGTTNTYTYNFRNVHGHIEVYEKGNGDFVVSADTYSEAVSFLLEILSEQ